MVNGSGTTGQNTSNKPSKLIKQFTFGGEGGIRTLDELLTHTPLAGERLQPLGHLSGGRTLVPFLGRAPEIGIIAAQGK